jgi:hypothetical protein
LYGGRPDYRQQLKAITAANGQAPSRFARFRPWRRCSQFRLHRKGVFLIAVTTAIAIAMLCIANADLVIKIIEVARK